METIIDKEPQSGEKQIDDNTKEEINNKNRLKEQLKNLKINERHKLLNTILLEERNEFIIKQRKEEQEEEKEFSKCPLSKKIKIMNFEIQDLKMELQKSKNEMNDMKNDMKNNIKNNIKNNTLKDKKKECKINTYSKKNKCPYSFFSLGSLDINTNKHTYNNDDDDEEQLDKFCEELTETYTNSFSWFFTIMFIVFILFILTSKPIKPLKPINLCDSLFF